MQFPVYLSVYRQKLEKSNFDLKMKVYYLEEGMKRIQETPKSAFPNSSNQYWDGGLEISKKSQIVTPALRSSNEIISGNSEILNLRLQLEEKHFELEQRNILLIKAKHAIEALKADLHRTKSEKVFEVDLEERIRKLRDANDVIEVEYREQLAKMDNELFNMKLQLAANEKDRLELKDKLVGSTNHHMSVQFHVSLLHTAAV